MAKRVAVIGAGVSGLIAIKACLDEGLEPVCFEKGKEIGGLWNFHPDARDGYGSVFRSTIINTSKEVMAFSDFPPPKKFANYMHNTKVIEYFKLYANHFGLLKYIHFNTKVESIKPCSDYDMTGRWDVAYTDTEKNVSKTDSFDAVMVCSGHHVNPHKPKFPRQDEFQGRIIHTHDYKTPKGYEDKRIVVIGIGNSGGDVSVELAKVGSQVFLSTRRGSWVNNRVGNNGYPLDLCGRRRYTQLIPASININMVKRRLNQRFDHANYGLLPEHSPVAQHPMVNDSLPNEILSGRIKIKANVKRFLKTAIEFEDGTIEEDIDDIVMATGYVFGFPFLDESVVKVVNNEVSLYKYIFPPTLKHGTLAMIGTVQPWGALNPISELQSRWATRVFKGLLKLPGIDVMMADIHQKKETMARRFVKSQRHTIQVDFIPYMDEIANEIGVRPNFRQMFCTDPALAWKCVFGPVTPYQYRLVGPGKWDGAKEAIETMWERVIYPTKSRPVKESNNVQGFEKWKFLIFVVLIVSFLITYYL